MCLLLRTVELAKENEVQQYTNDGDNGIFGELTSLYSYKSID